MLNTKIKTDKVIGICSLAIALSWGWGSLVAVAQAQEVTQTNNSKTIANSGLPSHRRDGGTRGNCIANGNNCNDAEWPGYSPLIIFEYATRNRHQLKYAQNRLGGAFPDMGACPGHRIRPDANHGRRHQLPG